VLRSVRDGAGPGSDPRLSMDPALFQRFISALHKRNIIIFGRFSFLYRYFRQLKYTAPKYL